MTKRIDFIDYTRGIAAVVVLYSHTLEIFVPNWKDTFEWFNLGQVGVVAFFLVSGYIIPYSMDKAKNIRQFILGRVTRIYPLYIFVALVTAVAFIAGIYHSPLVVKDASAPLLIFSHLLFIQDIIVGQNAIINFAPGNWTLLIEGIWYGFFVFLCLFHFQKNVRKVILYFNLFLLFLVIVSVASGYRLPYGRLCLISVCLIGYLLYTFHKQEISSKEFLICLIGSLVVLHMSLSVTFGYFENDTFPLTCVITSWTTGFILFFAFAWFPVPNAFVSKILSGLGTISYSLYLVHPNVIYSLSYIIRDLNIVLILVICLLASAGVSILTYNLIERPSIRYFREKLRKDNAA